MSLSGDIPRDWLCCQDWWQKALEFSQERIKLILLLSCPNFVASRFLCWIMGWPDLTLSWRLQTWFTRHWIQSLYFVDRFLLYFKHCCLLIFKSSWTFQQSAFLLRLKWRKYYCDQSKGSSSKFTDTEHSSIVCCSDTAVNEKILLMPFFLHWCWDFVVCRWQSDSTGCPSVALLCIWDKERHFCESRAESPALCHLYAQIILLVN